MVRVFSRCPAPLTGASSQKTPLSGVSPLIIKLGTFTKTAHCVRLCGRADRDVGGRPSRPSLHALPAQPAPRCRTTCAEATASSDEPDGGCARPRRRRCSQPPMHQGADRDGSIGVEGPPASRNCAAYESCSPTPLLPTPPPLSIYLPRRRASSSVPARRVRPRPTPNPYPYPYPYP